ncbi:hypothetical protein GCM10007876_24690 [Litoribrevibacter albus]|uniref:EamA domain-containing protein n=2 Tax=Litoribrevibacter albus TaxID=1473156 RepID=A0AA37W6V5_9GAMM|nr:hypothetical protein GCM10007876_24690 [Litoribrevibacter albus]
MHLNKSMKVFLLTSVALIAFAGNSIFCRLALGEERIDAASFTSIRLLTGIAVLLAVLALSPYRVKVRNGQVQGADEHQTQPTRGSWRAALMLFIYAIGFSYAYVSLETGTGALILFGAVQITMIAVGLVTGNRLTVIEWLGVLLAFAGFTYLMLPGVEAPSLLGFVFMAAAGVAWGFYTLAGKGSRHPLSDTAFNFVRTLPLVVLLIVLTISNSQMTLYGIVLAMLSGGLASGIGYTIWYMALEGLSAIQAAVLQLLVPIIATIGGFVFSGEEITLRFVIATLMVLGGILMVILGRFQSQKQISS